MVLNDPKKIIDKYFEGQTSLEEEQYLQQYFSSDQVLPELQAYKVLFQYFKHQKIEKVEVPNIELKKTHKLMLQWVSHGMVASLFLIVGLFTWQNYQKKQITKKAYQDSKKALALIGKYIHQGNQAVNQLKHIETTSQKIFNKQ